MKRLLITFFMALILPWTAVQAQQQRCWPKRCCSEMGKLAIVGGAVLLGAGLGAVAAGKTKSGPRGPQGQEGEPGTQGAIGPDGPPPGAATTDTLTFEFSNRAALPAGTAWVGIVVTPSLDVLVTPTLSPGGTTSDTITVTDAPEGAYEVTFFTTNFVAVTELMLLEVRTNGVSPFFFIPFPGIEATALQRSFIFEHPTDGALF